MIVDISICFTIQLFLELIFGSLQTFPARPLNLLHTICCASSIHHRWKKAEVFFNIRLWNVHNSLFLAAWGANVYQNSIYSLGFHFAADLGFVEKGLTALIYSLFAFYKQGKVSIRCSQINNGALLANCIACSDRKFVKKRSSLDATFIHPSVKLDLFL